MPQRTFKQLAEELDQLTGKRAGILLSKEKIEDEIEEVVREMTEMENEVLQGMPLRVGVQGSSVPLPSTPGRSTPSRGRSGSAPTPERKAYLDRVRAHLQSIGWVNPSTGNPVSGYGIVPAAGERKYEEDLAAGLVKDQPATNGHQQTNIEDAAVKAEEPKDDTPPRTTPPPPPVTRREARGQRN